MNKYLLSKLVGPIYPALSFRFLSTKYIEVLPEIQCGISARKPVVALESTIITHGMPYPHNLQTALEVEEIVRSQGAIPATIGILGGKIKVGLSAEDLQHLAKPETSAHKSSRRDIPYILSQNLNGGTTVSGTLLVCSQVGINLFVTGGIGGVHRDGHKTLDISADLTELGRHSIAVVSSGVKSILDIGLTLEYLETQGVCVATFGETNDFPAFFCRSSGYKSQYHVNTITDAAKLVETLTTMNTKSGLLIAVPVPKEYELIEREVMDTVIQQALAQMKEQGIVGKEVTPYLLKAIGEATEGKSLATNIALIKNNALVGSQIAVASSGMKPSSSRPNPLGGRSNSVSVGAGDESVVSAESSESARSANRGNGQSLQTGESTVVVVGGAMMDFTVKSEEDIKLDAGLLASSPVSEMSQISSSAEAYLQALEAFDLESNKSIESSCRSLAAAVKALTQSTLSGAQAHFGHPLFVFAKSRPDLFPGVDFRVYSGLDGNEDSEVDLDVVIQRKDGTLFAFKSEHDFGHEGAEGQFDHIVFTNKSGLYYEGFNHRLTHSVIAGLEFLQTGKLKFFYFVDRIGQLSADATNPLIVEV